MKQKFHLSIVSFALLSLVFSGFGSVTPAFATAPIDQSNFLHEDSGIGTSFGLGQGFTPLETDIVAIDIGLSVPCSGTWSVLIHNADIDGNADIGGSLVAPPIPHSVNADLTQHITFPSISLTPEDLYVIEIISSTTCSWLASTLNPYDRGTAFLGGFAIDVDFVFATYHSFGSETDSDDDGVGDVADNCPTVSNSGQEDGDGDGVGDACEPTGDVKKSCEVLDKASQNSNGKKNGLDKAKENNGC